MKEKKYLCIVVSRHFNTIAGIVDSCRLQYPLIYFRYDLIRIYPKEKFKGFKNDKTDFYFD
ncbi:hypothetical protein CUB95_12855 [Prevotella intermedia]|nr:hypothetical protein CUB95_12855 [Prevotella intermedia]